MYYVRAKGSMDLVGPISDSDLTFLRQQLESGVDEMLAFYLDQPTIDSWTVADAPPALVAHLNTVLNQRIEVDVEIVEGSERGGVEPISFGASTASENIPLDAPVPDVTPAALALLSALDSEPSDEVVEEEASASPEERQLNCAVCGTQIFRHERVSLRPAFAVVVDGTAPEVVPECFICGACGYLHWFMPSSSHEGQQ